MQCVRAPKKKSPKIQLSKIQPFERNEDEMNKKLFSMTISVLVGLSLALTACGATPTTAPAPTAPPAATAVPPTTPAPVTLTIWHNWGPDDTKGAPLQSVFKDFMAANPDITIKDSVYVDADIPLKV